MTSITTMSASNKDLIGRQQELSLLAPLRLFDGDASQLTTIIGPGGVGKTRLAREVLALAPDTTSPNVRPAAFVPLATVHTVEQVPGAIARALGDPGATGSTVTTWQSIARALVDRPWLLLLDNLEHLTELAPPLTALLTALPAVTMLATSRSALHIPGERVISLAPLPYHVPAAPERVPSVAARLFIRGGQRGRPTFSPTDDDLAAIETICARVDGLPLAIEIAAAQVRYLSPRAILAMLEASTDGILQLPLPDADDATDGDTSLAGVIARTYDRLPPREQVLFRRLALLPAGITPYLAEALGEPRVPTLPILFSLADRSLLVVGEDARSELRFGMLETIRGYAAWLLDRDTPAMHADVRMRLIAAFTALAEKATALRFTPDGPATLDRLDREFDSIRPLIDTTLASEATIGTPAQATVGALARLVVALEPLLLSRGHVGDGRRWAEQLLAMRSPASSDEEGARFQALALTAGRLASMHGAHDLALATLRELTQTEGVSPRLAAWATYETATVYRNQGALETGYPLLLAADRAFQSQGDTLGMIRARNALGVNRMDAGEFAAAEQGFSSALALAQTARNTTLEAMILLNLGYLATLQGDYRRAIALHEQCQELCEQTGDLGNRAMNMINLAGALIAVGELGRADALEEQALPLMRRLGNIWGEATVLYARGAIARRQGDLARERTLLQQQLPLRRALDNPGPIATNLLHLARSFRETGDGPRADLALAEAATLLDAAHRPGGDRVIAVHRALAAWYAGDPGAIRALQASLERLRREQGPAPAADLADALAFLAESTRSETISQLATTGTITATALRTLPIPLWADIAPSPVETPATILSGRERDVLRLVVAGRSDRQIADELFISPRTVGFHVSNILRKLGCSTRVEAAAWAARHNLA